MSETKATRDERIWASMSEEERDRYAKAQERYLNASHAIQAAVGAEMTFNPNPTEPKHLRTGLNVMMVDHGAVVELLIQKGLFTYLEVMEAIADEMEEEKRSYERRLSEHYGKLITLGSLNEVLRGDFDGSDHG